MAALLAVVGDLVEDLVVWVQGPVQRGSDTPAHVFRFRGGSAANVALATAALVPTRFLTCVGADPLGERLVAEMAGAGVEVRAQRRGRTGTVVVLVEVDGERSFLADRAAAAALLPFQEDVLDDVGLLHVPAYGLHGGTTATTVRELLEEAGRRRVPVSLDASSWSVLREMGDFRDLVERTRPEVLFANAEEARALDLLGRPPAGVTVAVKNGPRPTVVLLPDGGRLTVPVQLVQRVRDSTGAGDAFAAGWLSARMEGLDVEARVHRAHAMAREVLAAPGSGVRRKQEEPS